MHGVQGFLLAFVCGMYVYVWMYVCMHVCMHVRFLRPAGFAEVHLNSSKIWWEDVAGNEHKELWLVRAPADVSE